MLKLQIDFNGALSDFLGGLPEGSIASEEIEFSCQDRSYRLTAIRQGGAYRLALWDEFGYAAPEFEVACMGYRLALEEGEDGIDLGERSALELASLSLYLGGQRVGELQIVPEMPHLSPLEMEQALEQRQAWQTFYRMRTCPPLEVLKAGGERVERHCKVCSSCQELIHDIEGQKAWAELARHLSTRVPAPQAPRIQPGQVWSLLEELDGWDNHTLYLRAPQVLVLFENNGIHVVPVCWASALQDKGDVFLDESMGFAESWNRFILPREVMKECLGDVEEARIEEVIAQWGGGGLPMPKADWRVAFERLERHVASTMENRALAWALARKQPEKKTLTLKHWYHTFLDALRTLVSFSPRDMVPVAADDLGTVPFHFLRSMGFNVDRYRAQITDTRSDEDGVHVTGKLLLPEGLLPSLLYAWVDREEEEEMVPVRADLAGLYFSLHFPFLDRLDEKELRLAAVGYGE